MPLVYRERDRKKKGNKVRERVRERVGTVFVDEFDRIIKLPLFASDELNTKM